MKNKIREQWLSFNYSKKLFFSFISFQILFLFAYLCYFKSILIEKSKYFDDVEDPAFYINIFGNLEYSIVIVMIISILVYLLRDKISTSINAAKEKNILITSFSLMILIQLIILFFVKTELLADSIYYFRASESLYNKGDFYSTYGFKSSFWPVGVPLILYLLKFITNDNLFLMRILNIIVNLCFIMITYQIFKNNLNQIQRKIYLIVFSFAPFFLFGSNAILTDIYFSFFLYFSFYLIMKENGTISDYCFAGLSAGLSAYMRPTGIIIPFIIILYLLLICRVNFKKISFLFLVFIIVIFPWIYRNYQVFNTIVPMSTNGGYNFLLGNNEKSIGRINFDFPYDNSNPKESQESDKAYKKGFEDIKNNPIKTLIRIPTKIFFSYWRGDSYFIWSFKKTENELPPILLSLLFYISNLSFYVIVFLSLLSVLKGNLKVISKNVSVFVKLFLYCFLFIVIVFFGGDRFVVPLIPLHIFLVIKLIR